MKTKALLDVGQKANHGDGLDARESAADANFANLSIENIRVVLPKESRSDRRRGRRDGGQAGTKVSGNSVEILHEAVGEKYRCGIGFEAKCQVMKKIVGHVLGAWADLEDRDDFVDGTHGDPDPSDGLFMRLGGVCEVDGDVGSAEDGAEFIELDDGDG